ncbi:MAG TPA: hypothetical protein VFZ99_02815, partial [Terriglobales bacterium]
LSSLDRDPVLIMQKKGYFRIRNDLLRSGSGLGKQQAEGSHRTDQNFGEHSGKYPTLWALYHEKAGAD